MELGRKEGEGSLEKEFHTTPIVYLTNRDIIINTGNIPNMTEQRQTSRLLKRLSHLMSKAGRIFKLGEKARKKEVHVSKIYSSDQQRMLLLS